MLKRKYYVRVDHHVYIVLTKEKNDFPVYKSSDMYKSSNILQDLLEEIAENCLDLATDRSGCCLLQYCIPLAQEEQKARLIADVVANAYVLSEHSYGYFFFSFFYTLVVWQNGRKTITYRNGHQTLFWETLEVYMTISEHKMRSLGGPKFSATIF